ncbi:hypothetical protein GVN24_32425 [Rhizobium sp. CRIBSB]|nr:hypothetical protein [Rhizobium sp. CRIBSB]
MAEQPASGSGNTGLAFIIGAVVVVLAIVAWFVFSGGVEPQTRQIDVDVTLPEVAPPRLPAPPAGPPG